MKKFTSIILVVFICFLNIEADPVKVSVFYESLCPYCRNYLTTQIYPTYQNLSDYFTLDLVPFGKANITQDNDKWSFTCQHGPNECVGNKYQSCALAYGGDINIVNCIEASSDPASEDNWEQCCQEVGLSWKDIKNCYDSGEGDTLLVKNGNRTKSLDPPLLYVPLTWFNDKYNETLDDLAYKDFTKAICSFIDDKPPSCTT